MPQQLPNKNFRNPAAVPADVARMQLLDPKLDVVFKLLFADVRNRELLIALLEAVLKPTSPIALAEVLNPDIPKDLPADKGVVLDIHVRLHDGRHVDVEMQSEVHRGVRRRFLYYWARLHASQLTIGDHYEKLCPTVSVVILGQSLLPIARAHSTFRVLERDTHHELTDGLDMHFVELPKIDLADSDDPLAHWMRFLLARSEAELEELSMSDPTIRRATEALKSLSEDPAAQELARQRELAQINLKIMRQCEFEAGKEEGEVKGRAEGRVEGETKGRTEGEARAVLAILDARGIAATDEQSQRVLQCASLTQLEVWLRKALVITAADELFAD